MTRNCLIFQWFAIGFGKQKNIARGNKFNAYISWFDKPRRTQRQRQRGANSKERRANAEVRSGQRRGQRRLWGWAGPWGRAGLGLVAPGDLAIAVLYPTVCARARRRRRINPAHCRATPATPRSHCHVWHLGYRNSWACITASIVRTQPHALPAVRAMPNISSGPHWILPRALVWPLFRQPSPTALCGETREDLDMRATFVAFHRDLLRSLAPSILLGRVGALAQETHRQLRVAGL